MIDNRNLEDIDIEYEVARSEYEQQLYEEARKSYPLLFFKYKSLKTKEDVSRILDIIEENRIYLPRLKELNDPLEGLNSIILGNYGEEREAEIEKYRILALSEDGFLSTLWAYYADDYSGICFCYKNEGAFSNLEKMEYIDKQKMWSVDPQLSVQMDLQKKSKDWSHEKEWRYIVYDPDDCIQFLQYDKSQLACVLFGHRIEKETRDKIEKSLHNTTKIFTIHPDKERFCLYAEDKNGNRAYNSQELYEAIKAVSIH